MRFALLLCLLSATTVGCRKSAPTEAPAGSTVSPSSIPEAGHGETDLAALLAGLTQAIRKYAAEQQRAPKGLQELVAAGYLDGVPAAPAGKQFAIDKNLQVVLLDQ